MYIIGNTSRFTNVTNFDQEK